MYPGSSQTRRLLNLLAVILLLTFNAPASLGQLFSGPAGITLTARLESLSVSAVPTQDATWGATQHDKAHPISVLLTTSWAVPSNLTTVKVVENGTQFFSQSAGPSNYPRKRLDQLNIELGPDQTDRADPENQRRRIIILVQAL